MVERSREVESGHDVATAMAWRQDSRLERPEDDFLAVTGSTFGNESGLNGLKRIALPNFSAATAAFLS